MERAARITVTCVGTMAVFVGSWLVLQTWFAVGTGSAQALAAMVASLMLFVAGFWVFPEQFEGGDDAWLARLADRLATQVRDQWTDDEVQRKVRYPASLPVRWRSLGDTGPPRHGRVEEIAAMYRDLASGRLVVLGRAGAGKTVLAAWLALDLLRAAEVGAVPVLVSAGSWHPGMSLPDWLTGQLIRDHPFLARRFPRDGRSGARHLVDAGRILPILDGFDEIAPGSRAAALQALDATASMTFVLTSRVEEYAAAGASPVGAIVVQLDDLTVDDLAEYLPRTTPAPAGSPGSWDAVVERLRAYAAGADDPTAAVLARVLATPLMVFLARTIYSDTPGRTPADLLDDVRDRDAAFVERQLLTAYIPAVYASGRRRDRAEVWLTRLAVQLRELGTRDFAWWRLREAVPVAVRFGVPALVCGLAVGPVIGFAAWISTALGAPAGKNVGLGPGLGITLGFAVVGVPALLHAARRRARRPAPTAGLAGGLAGGTAGGLAAGLLDLAGIGHATFPAGGLGAGLAVGAALGPALGFSAGLGGGLLGGFLAALVGGVQPGLYAGVVNAVGTGLAVGLTGEGVEPRLPARGRTWSPIGLASGIAVGIAIGLAAGLTTGPVAGMVTGLTVGLAIGWVSGLSSSANDQAIVDSPAGALTRDRRAFLTYSLAGAVAGGLVGTLSNGLDDVAQGRLIGDAGAVVVDGLAVGITAAIVSGLMFGVIQAAWGSFMVARCWMALRGRLPWRLMHFLDDAHRRGVLRQIGAVYQFRNARLADHLAASHVVTPVDPSITDAPGHGGR